MSFLEDVQKTVQQKVDRVNGYKSDLEPLSNRELVEHYKSSKSEEERLAIGQIARERGFYKE